MNFVVGDLVVKSKGALKGRVGVVTRIYNRNNEGFVILEIFSNGEIFKWSENWCSGIPEEK